MPVRIESGAEPIPGYRLIERLGGGGFGEVWKAEAPGGLFKAIKFVYGDLQAADTDDGARAEQELKAMSRVKSVHHPYILSLERFDIIDGQLVIVMELADRTLWDRYKESRGQGLPGIPRDELLTYVQETAEALDLMNIQFQLQHLDIKPQNLFLVFKHIKVADFGLVKDLGAMGAATMTGGVTPVYAAPETFDGWLSRYSDQYSLAIVYQELLTGQRPFSGNTMRQLVLQHLQATPDVSSLPAAERPVILKALAKNPDDRFPTCVDMVNALRAAQAASATPAAVPRPKETPTPARSPTISPQPSPSTPSTPDSDFFKEIPSQALVDDKTWNARRPGSTTLSEASPPGPTPSHSRVSSPAPSTMLPRGGVFPSVEEPAPSSQLADEQHRGVIQPSLVIGLGVSGIQAIQQLRRCLIEEFGHADAVPHIRFLGISTDGENTRDSTVGNGSDGLRPHEFVLARLHRANHYLSKARDGKLPTDSWFNVKNLYRIAKENARASVRPLGRFAFVTNRALINKRIEVELQACCSQDTLHQMSKHTDIGIRTHVPRVYVIANLAGATGGGMFIDVAYLVRSHLRALGLEAGEVVGVFFLPPVAREGIRSAPLANAHAALAELSFFNQQEGMRARYDGFEAREAIPFEQNGVPFQRCYFLTLRATRLPAELEAVPEAILKSGHFLFRDLATPLGRSLDNLRQRRLQDIRLPGVAQSVLLESFGLYRLGWPRREVETKLAEKFCLRLVDRWKSKDAAHLAAEIDEWVGQQWDALQMRPESLIARHQDDCQQALGATPEKIFQDVLTPVAQAATTAASGSLATALSAVVAAVDQFDKMLGIPELCRDATHRNMEPGSLERSLTEVSSRLADRCDQKLAEIVVGLIEAPRYRLAGAEEALRRFNAVAESALKAQETLGRELQERAAALYTRIHEYTERIDKTLEPTPSTPAATSWFGRSKNPAAGLSDLLDLLRLYPKAQFQALLLQCLSRLYISLRGHLSDQLREVGFCRQRLDELAGILQSKPTTTPPQMVAFQKNLLPGGCKRLDDVVARLEENLVEDDFLAFDETIQAYVVRQYKALLNVCLGASGMVRALAPVMVHEATRYLDRRFPPPGVVDLLQSQGTERKSLDDALRDMYDAAAPNVDRLDDDRQLALATLPNDAAGEPLLEAMKASLPQVKPVVTDRCDEVVFVREQFLHGLSDLEQMGPVAHEAYRQRLAQDPTSLHSRDDIPDWNPHGAAVG